jgi:hypothetical protein
MGISRAVKRTKRAFHDFFGRKSSTDRARASPSPPSPSRADGKQNVGDYQAPKGSKEDAETKRKLEEDQDKKSKDWGNKTASERRNEAVREMDAKKRW